MAEGRRITGKYLLDHLNDNELDLSLTNLSEVPVEDLAQGPRVPKLDLSRNQLTTLPQTIESLDFILELDLSKNQLTELPDTFGQLIQLQRLDLFGNQLTELPLTFCQLKQLRWLDLKNNPLKEGFAKAAGACMSNKECRECAKNILKYTEELEKEAEQKRKKAMARKSAKEQREREEKRQRQEEAKTAKAKLRQRRKEEWERVEVEKRAQAVRVREAEERKKDEIAATYSEEKVKQTTVTWSPFFRVLCWLCGILVVVVAVGSVLYSILCPGARHTDSGWLDCIGIVPQQE